MTKQINDELTRLIATQWAGEQLALISMDTEGYFMRRNLPDLLHKWLYAEELVEDHPINPRFLRLKEWQD